MDFYGIRWDWFNGNEEDLRVSSWLTVQCHKENSNFIN